MEMMVWNIILTALVGVMAFLIKSRFDELHRLGILLNRTREEMAKEHVTRREIDDRMDRMVSHFDQRFNRIEAKIDEIRKIS